MNSIKVFGTSLQSMQNAFERMQNEAGWDTNEKLFWGYYFLDQDAKKLEQFALSLKDTGLSIVEIRKIEENDYFLLHAEEQSIHSAESLFDQCHKLATLAIKSEIEVFDGWDVEKVSLNKGFTN